MTDREFEDRLERLYRQAPDSEGADAAASKAIARLRRFAWIRVGILGGAGGAGLAVSAALLTVLNTRPGALMEPARAVWPANPAGALPQLADMPAMLAAAPGGLWLWLAIAVLGWAAAGSACLLKS